MEVTDVVSGVRRELVCVCLHWATEDEVYRAVIIPESLPERGEGRGIFSTCYFDAIVSTVKVMLPNIALRSLTSELLWALHISQLNRFFT